MLRTFVVFGLFCPSIVFTNHTILERGKNVSFIDTDDMSSSTPQHDDIVLQTTDRLPDQWVSDLFHRALKNFRIQKGVGSSACQKQTQMYVSDLKNNSYWAVKMYDSWSRTPNGILSGKTHQMGVYRQCIDVHQPIQGQYCMTTTKLKTVDGANPIDLKKNNELESHDHAWNEILGFIDYGDQYQRNEVKIGICIPESCTAENLKLSLQNELDSVFLPHRVQAKVNVDPMLCSTDKNVYPYDTGYYITRSILYLLLIICGVSTLIHCTVMTIKKEKTNDILPNYVYWFSVIHNGRNLIKYDKNNKLNIFNGLKTLTMVLILFGHRFLVHSTSPILYTLDLERIYRVGPDILLTCMNLVDPFFYITGFLMYVMIKPQLVKRGTGWIQVPMIIFYKYLRILPAYGFMMLLTAYFIPFMYNGPFWASKMWPEAEKCKNYWWTNFLATSNFIDVDHQCLIVGWYISCLIQFMIIGTILISVCVKYRKIGVGIISVCLCISLAIPFITTYVTQSYALIKILIPFLQDPSSSFEFRKFYRPFYMRGIPFYAGLMAGIIVEEMKKREIKPSKFVVYIWTFIITTVSFCVQYYGSRFYNRQNPYNVIEQATYSVLKHCTWTFMLFWITICYFTSGYGPIEKVLNNRFMTPLGRLSYVVYLVNIQVMMIMEFRQSSIFSPTMEVNMDNWIVGVYRTYTAGLVLYFIVEAPSNTIIKTIFFGSGEKDKDSDKRENAITENTPNDPRL
ncbi:nose resistant to fluoxetine protein 6-like [Rhopalosiphum maidis]|uniref:nose resistant to fluoxetine protein 6-like n=1 Tax=Rhopalosiphum maidis TaxID=43146 RepID=UPI000EFF03D3|nr:nose resistant to fluoxetine protein 6-like [Rhopalosiphum maidis]